MIQTAFIYKHTIGQYPARPTAVRTSFNGNQQLFGCSYSSVSTCKLIARDERGATYLKGKNIVKLSMLSHIQDFFDSNINLQEVSELKSMIFRTIKLNH